MFLEFWGLGLWGLRVRGFDDFDRDGDHDVVMTMTMMMTMMRTGVMRMPFQDISPLHLED